MNFKQKVQAMTAKEIVMAMVNGLQKEHVVVDMTSFGHKALGICYGCAATNTICEIGNIKPFLEQGTGNRWNHVLDSGFDHHFLMDFEDAIDALRRSVIDEYNYFAEELGIAKMPDPTVYLPGLNNHDYKKNLKYWIEFANTL